MTDFFDKMMKGSSPKQHSRMSKILEDDPEESDEDVLQYIREQIPLRNNQKGFIYED